MLRLIKSRVVRSFSWPFLAVLRFFVYLPVDIVERLVGRRDAITPPRRFFFGRTDGYKEIGEKFRGYFIDLGGLNPNDRILDAGCGIGRMAVPLTSYLNQEGRYEGFDIVPSSVKWCRKRITPIYPNFHFQHVNLYNKSYNPKGNRNASEFEFPYEDESFDFSFLTSVFTHMLPDDIENYLAEICRVLKSGGTCLITYFLINDVSRSFADSDAQSRDFKFEKEKYLTINEQTPEAAVAYEESYVRELYDANGLRLKEPIRYGSWCNRSEYLDFQDIIVAQKV